MDLLTLLSQLEHSQWERHNIIVPDKPILTRYDLQRLEVPKDDFEAHSSGSTGIPVTVQRSKLSRLWWVAANIRGIFWFDRDVLLPMAEIRAHLSEPTSHPSWGPAVDYVFGTSGPAYGHPVKGDLNEWLARVNPGYISTYPSIVETLDLNALPRLRGILTTGETLTFKRPLIADTYSSEEVGVIAIQCPDNSDCYHVMENILVELLDESDRPSYSGRVVVTDMTSSYVHRYDLGDYAETGECTCSRGLQTLRRILGRRRNMVVLPDGSRHWPRVGSHEFRSVAPIKRYQATQVSVTDLELRLVVERTLTIEEERTLSAVVHKWMGHPFHVTFIYVEGFPTGKFEEFVCRIT